LVTIHLHREGSGTLRCCGNKKITKKNTHCLRRRHECKYSMQCILLFSFHLFLLLFI